MCRRTGLTRRLLVRPWVVPPFRVHNMLRTSLPTTDPRSEWDFSGSTVLEWNPGIARAQHARLSMVGFVDVFDEPYHRQAALDPSLVICGSCSMENLNST